MENLAAMFVNDGVDLLCGASLVQEDIEQVETDAAFAAYELCANPCPVLQWLNDQLQG